MTALTGWAMGLTLLAIGLCLYLAGVPRSWPAFERGEKLRLAIGASVAAAVALLPLTGSWEELGAFVVLAFVAGAGTMSARQVADDVRERTEAAAAAAAQEAADKKAAGERLEQVGQRVLSFGVQDPSIRERATVRRDVPRALRELLAQLTPDQLGMALLAELMLFTRHDDQHGFDWLAEGEDGMTADDIAELKALWLLATMDETAARKLLVNGLAADKRAATKATTPPAGKKTPAGKKKPAAKKKPVAKPKTKPTGTGTSTP